MSNSIDKFQVYKLEDPLLDLETKPSYVIERSAQSSNIKTVPSTQFSGNQITYTYLPSSGRTIISRNIRSQVTIKFIFTGQDQGSALLGFGSTDSFLMLNYGVQSSNLTIDGGNNSITESDVFPIFHRYINTKSLNDDIGYTFNSPDLMYNYDLPFTQGMGYNANRNFGETNFADDSLRGRYWPSLYNIIENSNTRCEVDVTFISPIILKPLDYHNNLHINKGLFGVESLTFILTLQDNFYKYVWAHAPSGNVVDNVTYAITGTPSLFVQEFELQPDQSLPLDLVSYDYVKYYSQVTGLNQSVAANVKSSITSSNNQLGGTPDWIMFYIREQYKDISPNNPKTALPITRLQITFDTAQIFNNADPQQLYEISKKNGYNGLYEDFINYSGSYIKLKFPTDVNVQALDGVGRLLKHQLNITADFINNTGRTITPEIVLVIGYRGIWTKGYNYSQPQINIVSANDILNSADLPNIPRDMLLMDKMYGGFSAKDVYNKISTVGPKAVKFLKECGPQALDIVNDLRGNGYAGNTGGKIAKRSNLRNRLRDY